jgi:hypothetical protein
VDQTVPFLPHVPQFPPKLICPGKWTFAISRFILKINSIKTFVSDIGNNSLVGVGSKRRRKPIKHELVLMFMKVDIVLIFFSIQILMENLDLILFASFAFKFSQRSNVNPAFR